MTQTNISVLEQACRNTRGMEWVSMPLNGTGLPVPLILRVSSGMAIRTEYHRLMRLRASKKRWRNVSNYTKHQQAVSRNTVRG